MMLLALILAGIAFYETFVALGAVRHIAEMSAAGARSVAVVRDTAMDDDEKGRAMRQASGAIFLGTGLMLAKTLLAVAAAGVVLWALALVVPSWTLEGLLAYSVSLVGLIGVIVALVVYGKLRHGRG